MNCVGFFGGEVFDEQGCIKGFGFFFGEIVCGGVGVILYFYGVYVVYMYMINMCIIDVEFLEKCYLVFMREFSICCGSGGKGVFNGGDGC